MSDFIRREMMEIKTELGITKLLDDPLLEKGFVEESDWVKDGRKWLEEHPELLKIKGED